MSESSFFWSVCQNKYLFWIREKTIVILKDWTKIKFIKKQVLHTYLSTYRISKLSALTAAVVVKKTEKEHTKRQKKKKKYCKLSGTED